MLTALRNRSDGTGILVLPGFDVRYNRITRNTACRLILRFYSDEDGISLFEYSTLKCNAIISELVELLLGEITTTE